MFLFELTLFASPLIIDKIPTAGFEDPVVDSVDPEIVMRELGATQVARIAGHPLITLVAHS